MNQEKYNQKKALLETAKDAIDNAIGINNPLDGELRDILYSIEDAIVWLNGDYKEYE